MFHYPSHSLYKACLHCVYSSDYKTVGMGLEDEVSYLSQNLPHLYTSQRAANNDVARDCCMRGEEGMASIFRPHWAWRQACAAGGVGDHLSSATRDKTRRCQYLQQYPAWQAPRMTNFPAAAAAWTAASAFTPLACNLLRHTADMLPPPCHKPPCLFVHCSLSQPASGLSCLHCLFLLQRATGRREQAGREAGGRRAAGGQGGAGGRQVGGQAVAGGQDGQAEKKKKKTSTYPPASPSASGRRTACNAGVPEAAPRATTPASYCCVSGRGHADACLAYRAVCVAALRGINTPASENHAATAWGVIMALTSPGGDGQLANEKGGAHIALSTSACRLTRTLFSRRIATKQRAVTRNIVPRAGGPVGRRGGRGEDSSFYLPVNGVRRAAATLAGGGRQAQREGSYLPLLARYATANMRHSSHRLRLLLRNSDVFHQNVTRRSSMSTSVARLRITASTYVWHSMQLLPL